MEVRLGDLGKVTKAAKVAKAFLLISLFLVTFSSIAYSLDVFCKVCDLTYLTIDIGRTLNITNKINVTAQLIYLTIPSTTDNPEYFIEQIQSGKINIQELGNYIPSAAMFNETVEIYFKQNVSGTEFETLPHCKGNTNENGTLKCEIEIPDQGCGGIYAFYNGTEKYYGSVASVPYCVRGTVPFSILLPGSKPEERSACFALVIFIGLLVAGMYALGKNPIGAFELGKPKIKSSTPIQPQYKYKRYGKMQVDAGIRNLKMASKRALINSLAAKLAKRGIIPMAAAGSIKKIETVPEKNTALLKEMGRSVDGTRAIQKFRARELKALSLRVKKAKSAAEAAKAEAVFKKAQEEHIAVSAKLEEKEEIYNKLLKTQRDIIDNYVGLLKNGEAKSLTGVIAGYIGSYHELMSHSALGVKQDPIQKIMTAINPNKLGGHESMILAPMLRAKMNAEEAINSAIYFVSNNINKLPADSEERKFFEKYFGSKAKDTHLKFLEEKLMGINPDAYDRYMAYLDVVNRSKSSTELQAARQKLIEYETEQFPFLKREVERERQKLKKEEERIAEDYSKKMQREKEMARDPSLIIQERMEHADKAKEYKTEKDEILKSLTAEEKLLDKKLKWQKERLDDLFSRKPIFRSGDREKEQYEEVLRHIKELDPESQTKIQEEWNDFQGKTREKLVDISRKIDENYSNNLEDMIAKAEKFDKVIEELDKEVTELVELESKWRYKPIIRQTTTLAIGMFNENFTFKPINDKLDSLQKTLLEDYEQAALLFDSASQIVIASPLSHSLSLGTDEAQKCAKNIVGATKYRPIDIVREIRHRSEAAESTGGPEGSESEPVSSSEDIV